jgi:LEA14-like dessication related protein
MNFATGATMKRRILNFSSLLLLLLLLPACGKVEDPQFRRLENFGLKKVGLEQATISFDATFLNPNQFGLKVKEADLDIYADSVYLGKFKQPLEIEVQPGSEFSIPLEGIVTLQQVLTSEWKRLAGKEVLLRATGAVKAGKAGVFITKAIAYQGRHKLDINLIKNPAAAGF